MARKAIWPAGFYDVNRVHMTDATRLNEAGWVGVLGDPNRVILRRVGWWLRLQEWLGWT